MSKMYFLPFRPAFDSAGITVPGSQHWFTLAGTNTPSGPFADVGLTTPLANPVVSNGIGYLPPIYLDPGISYRVRVYDEGAEVGVDTPLEEYDPYVPALAYSDLLAALAASGGGDLVNFLQSGTGAVARTSQSKLRDIVSVKDFGAIGNGVTDDTAAIQAAINSGASAILVPHGSFLVSSILMPNVSGFVLFGLGSASKLIAKSGAANALIRWATASEVYNAQTICSLQLIGTSGSQHLIDTTGQGGLTVRDILITDVPVGKSGIYDNSVGVVGHDNRFRNIQIYSPTTAGHSGIRLGPLSADISIDDYIFNGNFLVSYGIYADTGAFNVKVSSSHIYNAGTNIVKLNGTNNYFQFGDTTFDNANGHLVAIADSTQISFTNSYFEAVKSGQSAVSVTGTGGGIGITESLFEGSAGAVSCVVTGASVTDVRIQGGSFSGTFTTPFNLGGARSWARGIAGYSPLGLAWAKSGVQATAQAQNTVRYLGEGDNATEANAVYVVPYDSTCNKIFFGLSATPAAGQTFTFQARKNGVNIGSALVINNGGFGGTITLGTSFAQYDQLTIQSTFSATSGAATVRFCADFTA